MANEAGSVERFTASERTVHVLLFCSLIILSITGLSLKYHESWLGQAMVRLEGGVLLRGKVHRMAAIVLVATFAYHLFAIVFTRRGRDFFEHMIFRKKDFTDGADLIRYNMGLLKEKPRFDRFTCVEKLQYWVAGLAVVFLGLSGFMLWFETFFMELFPKWIMDLNHVVHSFEATVGFLVLVVWHLYNVHLNPQVFPMSRTWLDGRISNEELKRDHPIEYERLFGIDKD